MENLMVWHKVRSNYVNERNSVDTLALRIRNCFRLSRETMPISTNIFTKMVFKNHDKIAGAARRNVWRSAPPFDTAWILERKQLQIRRLRRRYTTPLEYLGCGRPWGSVAHLPPSVPVKA